MTTANERRLKVRDQYRRMIGRNHYSQARRNYAVSKYKDGKYYSDCSSSVSYAYKAAGEGFGILNTVGMWTSTKMVDVPVKIVKGQIANPDALRVGDMLLFAGNDAGRKKYGYVGHVEMVGEINGATVQLYGHGSGLAKRHEMTAYCRNRYNAKAATPLGRRLLIRVRRAIADDAQPAPESAPDPREIIITGGTVNVRSGPGTQYAVVGITRKGARLALADPRPEGGWYMVRYGGMNGWVSGRYARPESESSV